MEIKSINGTILYTCDCETIADALAAALQSGANLGDAKDIPYIPLACPSDGEFTA